MKEKKNEVNEQIKGVINAARKKIGMTRKQLAEKMGVSETSLSITLSPQSGNIISTTKLLELATALNRHLVIGFLTDEQLEEFERRITSKDGEESTNTLKYCPQCGEPLKTYIDNKKKSHRDKSISSDFVVCESIEIDIEAKKAQKEKTLETYERLGRSIGEKK